MVRSQQATATGADDHLHQVARRVHQVLRKGYRAAVVSARRNRGALTTLGYTVAFALVVGGAGLFMLRLSLPG